MHHALHIEESLDMIFSDPILRSQADGDTWPAEGWAYRRYPLLALALTCKTFHEPAIRLLWRQIDGIDRLVRTMTRDVVRIIIPRGWHNGKGTFQDDQDEIGSVEGRQTMERCIVFKKEPTEFDWSVFDRYAAYIHEFGSTKTGSDRFKLGDNVCRVLRFRFAGHDTPLLPKLRILTCGGCMQLRYANLLLSSPLHTLRICQSPHECCFSCIATFIVDVKNSPTINLQNIYLSAYMPADLVSLCSGLLAKCGSLRKLDMMGIRFTPDMIKLALQGNTLEEISARVAVFNIDDILDGNEDRNRWNLKKFDIESGKMPDHAEVGGTLESTFYSELIRRLGAPGLVDFRFQGGPQHPLAQDIRRFLELVSRGGGFCDGEQAWRIPCIRLTPGTKRRSDIPRLTPLPEGYICTFANALHSFCKPLNSSRQSRFSQLRILDLDGTFVDLTDSELGMVTESMPHLKSLNFCATRETRRGKSRTTLVGLWLLAKSCRELESVSMWIDAALDWDVLQTLGGFANVPARDEDTRRTWLARGQNEQLHLLYVGDSTIREARVVADFIKLVFPRIRNLHYISNREPTRDTEMWRAVRHQLD